jgi:hypothetical protein
MAVAQREDNSVLIKGQSLLRHRECHQQKIQNSIEDKLKVHWTDRPIASPRCFASRSSRESLPIGVALLNLYAIACSTTDHQWLLSDKALRPASLRADSGPPATAIKEQ